MTIGTILLAVLGGFDDTVPPGTGFFTSKPRLLFDDSTDEIIHRTFRMPSNYASAPVLKLQYSMTSATTLEVVIACEVMATTDGESQAVDSDGYDTINVSGEITVPGTAGHMDEISLALTNADSVAAGDLVFLRIRREGALAGDDASGDMEWLALSLEYTTT